MGDVVSFPSERAGVTAAAVGAAWRHVSQINPAPCTSCGAWARNGWVFVDPRVRAEQHFTCDECAEALQ